MAKKIEFASLPRFLSRGGRRKAVGDATKSEATPQSHMMIASVALIFLPPIFFCLGEDMPISLHVPIRRMSQLEFGELSFEVMRQVFAIQHEGDHVHPLATMKSRRQKNPGQKNRNR